MTTLPPVHQEEKMLIELCQQGNMEACSRLINHYKEWVFGNIFRWIGHKETAEEMAQDTFTRSLKEISSFRKDAKFSTWLYRIMLNLCRDYWRSQRAGRIKAIALDMDGGRQSETVLEDQAIAIQNISKIRQVLGYLPEEYREVIYLKYINEMTYAEIADSLGHGISAVKMRVARGLKMLRDKL